MQSNKKTSSQQTPQFTNLFALLTATDRLLIVLSTLADDIVVVVLVGAGSTTAVGSSAVTTENSVSSLIITLPGDEVGGMSSEVSLSYVACNRSYE